MPPTEPIETELKFALGGGAREMLETALFRDGKTSDLVATYFDTPGLALFTHGYGLRVRRKGQRFVQTLKSHGDGLFARGEWEADVPSAALDATALAATPAAEIAAAATLEPLFGVEVRRTAAVIVHGASRIEAALDVGRVWAGDRSEPIEELELELVEGDPADLFDLARSLDAPLVLAFATKSERGYRLARGITAKPEGPLAALRKLSDAILRDDELFAASAAAELGVAVARRSQAPFDRALWARVLLDAAQRAFQAR